MIEKEKAFSVTALALGSLMLDFMLLENTGVIFPRERIIHLLLSAMLAMVIVMIINKFNISRLKYLVVIFIFVRLFNICNSYINYYNSFHGSNTFAIILFTVIIVLFFWKFICEKVQDIYSFYIVINLLAVIFILLLCYKHLNVSNIYANDLRFDFKINNLFLYYDVISIFFVLDNKKLGKKFSIAYVIIGTIIIGIFIILQGLCIDGNILYNISPLQALIQIFSTSTILRYDYIFTIWSTLNYFGTIMLYTWMLKNICGKVMNGKKI